MAFYENPQKIMKFLLRLILMWNSVKLILANVSNLLKKFMLEQILKDYQFLENIFYKKALQTLAGQLVYKTSLWSVKFESLVEQYKRKGIPCFCGSVVHVHFDICKIVLWPLTFPYIRLAFAGRWIFWC